jgi:hypothetical protein
MGRGGESSSYRSLEALFFEKNGIGFQGIDTALPDSWQYPVLPERGTLRVLFNGWRACSVRFIV